MAKRYARVNWQNRPNVATPISATNLNKMDKGIDDIDTALNNLENSIVGQIVNDPTKINNAAVNYSLAQQITQLNNNLTVTTKNLVLPADMNKASSSYSMRFGKIVNVCFGVSGNIPANTLTHIATIDDIAHYPYLDIQFPVIDAYGNAGFGLISFDTGKIQVRFPVAVTSARGCVVYIKT